MSVDHSAQIIYGVQVKPAAIAALSHSLFSTLLDDGMLFYQDAYEETENTDWFYGYACANSDYIAKIDDIFAQPIDQTASVALHQKAIGLFGKDNISEKNHYYLIQCIS